MDDATRLPNLEVLADQQMPTVSGFLARAVAWFDAQDIDCRRVTNDKGAFLPLGGVRQGLPHSSDQEQPVQAVHAQDQRHSERLIQTLCRERAYPMAFQDSQERNHSRPRYLSIYSRLR